MEEQAYTLTLDMSLDPTPVLPALIWAEGINPPCATSDVPPFLADAITAAKEAGEDYVPAELRARVRKMLRYGKYHASGRGKPASEFLLRAALGNTFPLVNEPVDVNNAISLASGLPGSIFDTGISGAHLLVRRGMPGEAYVFNNSGQRIDLQDLLLICRRKGDDWEPCGNPVKDAMTTKIHADTRNVVAVLYAPSDEPKESISRWAERYAALLSSHCHARATGVHLVTA